MTTIYAALDASGAPFQIEPGGAFTTYYVVVADEQEATWSGVAIGQVAPFEVSHSWTFLDTATPEILARYCISALTIAAPPNGQELAGYGLAAGADGAVTAAPTYAPVPLATAQAQVAAQIQAKSAAVIAGGYSTGGLHVQVDDGSRANLTALGATAIGVLANVAGVTWPANYAKGWISLEGSLIPLPTAADGRALATGAGNFYSAAVQNEGALLAQVQAAANTAACLAIDWTAGWPT